jgi:hypothetical protein
VEVQVPVPQVDSLKKVAASPDFVLAELRKRIAGKPLFDGCQITSGKYHSGPGQEDTLVLEGHVGFGFQKAALSESCLDVLRDRYGTLLTALTPAPTPVMDQLKLIRPSAEAALSRIQASLGQNPDWDGIQITQARYEDDQDRVILVVEGRLSEARLRSYAARVCESVMQETFASANGVFPVPKLDQLPVLKPAPREAATAFNEGLQHYRKGNYESAGREFARAVSENPFHQSYKYWRVVNELAAGHDNDARRLMRPLILRRTQAKTTKQADEYTDVLRRLESVQGTVRQKMNRLEEELLRETAAKKGNTSRGQN